MTASSDLVARLGNAKTNGDPAKYLAGITVAEAHEAAARILALEADKVELVEALSKARPYIEKVIEEHAFSRIELDEIDAILAKAKGA